MASHSSWWGRGLNPLQRLLRESLLRWHCLVGIIIRSLLVSHSHLLIRLPWTLLGVNSPNLSIGHPYSLVGWLLLMPWLLWLLWPDTSHRPGLSWLDNLWAKGFARFQPDDVTSLCLDNINHPWSYLWLWLVHSLVPLLLLVWIRLLLLILLQSWLSLVDTKDALTSNGALLLINNLLLLYGVSDHNLLMVLLGHLLYNIMLLMVMLLLLLLTNNMMLLMPLLNNHRLWC